MLKVGENGAGKTEIMYSANMSYRQIQKYLGFLVGQGFIDKMKMGLKPKYIRTNGERVLRIKRWVQKYRDVKLEVEVLNDYKCNFLSGRSIKMDEQNKIWIERMETQIYRNAPTKTVLIGQIVSR